MNKNKINHNALTHLIEAGAVSVATAKATGDTWILAVQVGDTPKVVMAKNSGKPRVWRKLDTLTKYLKDLGVDKFLIDATEYDPSLKSLKRPDSANTLKQTHKSHQALQKQSEEPSSTPNPMSTPTSPSQTTKNQSMAEPEIRVKTQSQESQIEVESTGVREPVSLNATDKAIEKAKERWEHRRAKILQEADPRAK